MKTNEIRCKATGTEFDGNLTINELATTLFNYFKDDFCLDIDEVIKYCEFQEISLLEYFIDGHKFDKDLTHIINRYEILDETGEVVEIDEVLPALYDSWAYHWFYDGDCPKFVITDANNQSHVVSYWDDIKNSFNWAVVDVNILMSDLLKLGQYRHIDMAAADNFTIEILAD
jgi:hypothetical protein